MTGMNFPRSICLLALALSLGACREKTVKSGVPKLTPAVEIFGRNLLENADAEATEPVTRPDKTAQKDAPLIWTKTPDVIGEEYGRASDEWPDAKAGCPDGRKRYFRLAMAINESNKHISQSVVVGDTAADIDAGRVECALGGWFGGWVGGDASAKLEVEFFGDGDRPLGKLATEPPDPAALKPEIGRAALVKQLAAGPVPKGTRRIEARLVALRMTPTMDSNAVAAADNLSVVLRKKEQ
jgi:hypothetical protein